MNYLVEILFCKDYLKILTYHYKLRRMRIFMKKTMANVDMAVTEACLHILEKFFEPFDLEHMPESK